MGKIDIRSWDPYLPQRSNGIGDYCDHRIWGIEIGVLTKYQFLFTIYNTNISVFGTMEWLSTYSASEDRGEMPLSAQVTIDIATIHDQV
jgi:hypothetical protein